MINRSFFRAVLAGAVVAFIGLLAYVGISRLGRTYPASGYNSVAFDPANLAVSSPSQVAAPYVSSEYDVVRAMLALARAGPEDLVADLGSGDGRIPIIAAREKGARGLGVDIDAALVRQSIVSARTAGVGERVTFRQEDLFTTPLQDVTVLTLFLLPEINLQLRPRILEQMRPGTRVVSNQFDMGDWRPDRIDNDRSTPIYLWIVPAQVAGTWQISAGGQSATLAIQQHFQQIGGTVTAAGRARPLAQPQLQGDRIAFTADLGGGPRRFSGQLVDGQLRGEGWQAVRTGN